MANPNTTGLPQQVLDSLHAGRITAEQANSLKHTAELYSLEHVLEFLHRLERSNTTGTFFREDFKGFILRGFHYRSTWPVAKKRQVIAALAWALEIIATDLEGGDLS
jgi:hypothetical protein